MSFASDVQSVQKTDTATAVNGRTRLQGLYFTNTGTAATLTFRSGGGSGTVKLTVNTPAAAGAQDLMIPDNGILFENGIHVTFSSAEVTSVTLLFVGGAAA